MKENRRFDRFLLDIEIEHHKKDDKKKLSRTKSKNLSKGGICITTDDGPLEKGEIYVLSFTLPGQSRQIIVEGKVAWNKKYTSINYELFDNGIQFINISNKQLEMIEEFRLGSVFET
ncbi:MAG: PilZ domain-containing protein [Spirochaetales bacterium]|nr:PilZ domain-containing protein [Spirochaetales bacterium]